MRMQRIDEAIINRGPVRTEDLSERGQGVGLTDSCQSSLGSDGVLIICSFVCV